MPRDARSNIYAFAGPGAGGQHADDGARATDQTPDRADEMRAVLSCLEYLYGEAVRLQARMSAHLIGAAAESLRREIADTASNG